MFGFFNSWLALWVIVACVCVFNYTYRVTHLWLAGTGGCGFALNIVNGYRFVSGSQERANKEADPCRTSHSTAIRFIVCIWILHNYTTLKLPRLPTSEFFQLTFGPCSNLTLVLVFSSSLANCSFCFVFMF